MASASSDLTRMGESLLVAVDGTTTIGLRLATSAGNLRAAGVRVGNLAAHCPGDLSIVLTAFRWSLESAAQGCIEASAQLTRAQLTARGYAREIAGNGRCLAAIDSGTTAGSSSDADGDGLVPRDLGTAPTTSLQFAPGIEAVRLSSLRIPSDLIPADLFDARPAKGASKEDMIWAAECFRDAIIPHLESGSTKEEIEATDSTNDRVGLRRWSGAWDVYLGDNCAKVDLAPDGSLVSITNGAHRILAAHLAGLEWIPMRVTRLADWQVDRYYGGGAK